MESHALLLALLAAAPLAGAQTRFYTPAPFAHHDGITSTGYPIGYSSITKMTYQQVHAGLPATPLPILRIAFRPRATSASHAAFSINLTLVMGLGGPAPGAASATFLPNLGPNPATVMNQANVNIPAFNQAGIAPAPYHYAFPLPAPFLYDGSGRLCWEMRVHNHTFSGSNSFDLYSTQTAITLRSGGRGCTGSGQSAPATLSGSVGTGSLSLNCTGLPANQPTLLAIGLRSTHFGALALPFDLTPFGAPCALRNDLLLSAVAVATASGASWQFPVPAAAPDGTAIFFQALVPDAQANPFGLVLSNGLAAIWPYARQPVVRIWTTGSDQATTGSLQLTYGLVMEMGF